MDRRTEKLMDFLDHVHSPFHCAAYLERELQAQGYELLPEWSEWKIVPGGKYYTVRGGTALMAFRVPQGTPKGFMLSAGHGDRPAFKVKENGELTGAYSRLSVERYGGLIISTWLDRPLSVAGQVMVETEQGIQSRLVDLDRDLMLIPSVAIHMNRTINDGYKWDLTRDVLPLMGSGSCAGKLTELLEEAAGGKVLGHDLTLYVREKARVWGVEEEYLSAQALDDLGCVWGCFQGFLNAGESESIPVMCLFDNEEVGSSSPQGADSDLLDLLLSRICKALGLCKGQMLARSMMVSADNAHAMHPNHPELADPKNAPVMGQGVVVKFNATLRYTSDGYSVALFRSLCQKAGVKCQNFYNRADILGGSTLGNISVNHVSVASVDIGLPQVAMHSCYETCAVSDAMDLEEVMKLFYGTTLERLDTATTVLG